jgi:uncharacterized repeat protein (TIGR01451 family)
LRKNANEQIILNLFILSYQTNVGCVTAKVLDTTESLRIHTIDLAKINLYHRKETPMKRNIFVKFGMMTSGAVMVVVALTLPMNTMTSYARIPLVVTEDTPRPPATVTVAPPPGGSLFADPYVLKSGACSSCLKQGDTAQYTIVAGNKGNTDAVNVQVRDALPPNMELISINSTRGTVINPGNGTFIVDIGTLPQTELITIIVTVRVKSDAQPGPVSNVATLNTTSGGDNVDNNIAFATCTVCTPVLPPTGEDLTITNWGALALILGGTLLIVSSFVINRKKIA